MLINGAELKITLGSFAEAMALQKAIGRALRGMKIDLPDNAKADLSPDSIGDILGAVLNVATSDEVETALFACAGRCLIGQDKVDKDYFEKAENRQNYYPIMIEIIKANCGPFIKGLGSSFGGLGQLLAKSPASK
jgi:hypothetical protein